MTGAASRGWAAAAVAGGVLAVLAVGAWKAWGDPGIAWLAASGDARWIRYPTPAWTVARPLVEVPAAFRRDLDLEAAPRTATLRVRAFRRAEVLVNGVPAPISLDRDDWKAPREAEVGPLLRPGRNQLLVVVRNRNGPPALWLELRADRTLLVSDGSWSSSLAGATTEPAVAADDPPGGRRYDPTHSIPGAWQALRERWATLLAFAALSVAAVAAASAWGRRLAAGGKDPLRFAPAILAVLWAALFWNDTTRALPLNVGFDARQHMEYVRYVLQRHAIPLANEGWQMFQPPLYYLLVAGALAVAGVDPSSQNAAFVVRGLNLAIGIAHVAIVAAFLRRLFPDRPAARAAGLVVAAFLPPVLYLHEFPTNELLGAALGDGVLLVSLAILQDGGGLRRHLLLGALLGLALLAKFSTLLLVPIAFGAAAFRAVRGPREGLVRRVAVAAAAGLAAIAVCGWHFARVWARFGDPFVGGWEARPGLGWWLDPGYRTAAHFLRFGRVFSDPLFSGFGGFWDGIYSTLWGDGLLSGLDGTALSPWWSPSLHSAGYLLALVPAACIAIGGLATLRAFVTRTQAADALLLATTGLVLSALALMTLRVPSVAQDKAFYGLMALAPLAALAARGFLAIANRRRVAGLAVLAALGTWAMTSYSTFWTDRKETSLRLRAGVYRARDGDLAGGLALLRATQREAPEAWPPRIVLARVLLDTHGSPDEIASLLRVSDPAPDTAARHLAISMWADDRGDLPLAIREAQRATSLDPDDPWARFQVAQALERAGERAQAEAAFRELLRIDPFAAPAHTHLAMLLALRGEAEEAAFHGGLATQLLR